MGPVTKDFDDIEKAVKRYDSSLKKNVGDAATRAAKSTDVLTAAEKRFAQSMDQAAGAAQRFTRNLKSVESQSQATRREVEATAGSLKRTLLASASVIAGAFGTRELMKLSDMWTGFTNRLKSAGLEGEKLAGTQDALFAISQRYGAQLQDVGTLYGRVTQAQKELGATTDQVMMATEGAAAALRLYGASQAEQQGALLQFSQMLGNSRIQMQEFNSINDGARPILQAVANGIERFGGSVAKLRAEIVKGGMDTKEFFQGYLRGIPAVIAQAEKMPLTISASLTTLNNALGKYVGQTGQATGATAAVSGAIVALADNLDTVMPILLGIATALAGRYVAGMTAATAATVLKTAADVRATIAAQALAAAETRMLAGGNQFRAITMGMSNNVSKLALTMGVAAAGARAMGSAVLAAFGGPVGLAITGLALVVMSYYRAVEQAKQETIDFNKRQREAKALFDEQAGAAHRASGAIDDYSKSLTGASNAVRYQKEFAGATGDAARALQDQAREARNAKIQVIALALEQAKTDRDMYAKRINPQRVALNEARAGRGQAPIAPTSAREREAETRVAQLEKTIKQLEETARAVVVRPLASWAQGANSPFSKTGGRDLAAEISKLQSDLVAANKTGNATAQKEILSQIKLRQKITEYIKDGLSFEVASATAQAEALKTTEKTNQVIKFTGAMADEALRSIGATVTSSKRTRAQQETAYAKYKAGTGPLAAKPGTSYHEKDMARDIAKTPGMSLVKIRQAIEARGGKIVELLDEGTHFHVAWARTAKSQAATADDQLHDQDRFQSELQQLEDDLLQAKGDQIADAEQVAAFERQRVNAARDREKQDIQNRVALGQLGVAEGDILLAKNEELRVAQLSALAAKEDERKLNERTQIQTALIESQNEMLSIADGLATTAEEHRRLQLQMLENEKTLAGLELDRVIASTEASEADKAIARAKKSQLDALYGAKRDSVIANTRGPIENYLKDLPRSAEQVGEAIQHYVVDQLEEAQRRTQQLAEGIGGAFGRAAASIAQFQNPLEILQSLLTDLATQFTQTFIQQPVQDWATRMIGGPVSEKLMGGAPSGPYGLDAAQINQAYSAGVVGVQNFTAAVAAATQAMQSVQTQGITPLGTAATQTGSEFASVSPQISQFGSSLLQVISGIAGGGGGGMGGILGTVLSLGGAIFGGGGGIQAGDISSMMAANPGVFATGGWIGGKGTGTSDSNLIRASLGEHITNAASAKKYAPLLDLINADRLPGFSKGGRMGRINSPDSGLVRAVQFGDIIVQGGGSDRDNRRTGRQIGAEIRNKIGSASKVGMSS